MRKKLPAGSDSTSLEYICCPWTGSTCPSSLLRRFWRTLVTGRWCACTFDAAVSLCMTPRLAALCQTGLTLPSKSSVSTQHQRWVSSEQPPLIRLLLPQRHASQMTTQLPSLPPSLSAATAGDLAALAEQLSQPGPEAWADWSVETVDVPRQTNGYDCGVFMVASLHACSSSCWYGAHPVCAVCARVDLFNSNTKHVVPWPGAALPVFIHSQRNIEVVLRQLLAVTLYGDLSELLQLYA